MADVQDYDDCTKDNSQYLNLYPLFKGSQALPAAFRLVYEHIAIE